MNNLVQQLSGTQHFFLQEKLISHVGNWTLQWNLNIEIKVSGSPTHHDLKLWRIFFGSSNIRQVCSFHKKRCFVSDQRFLFVYGLKNNFIKFNAHGQRQTTCSFSWTKADHVVHDLYNTSPNNTSTPELNVWFITFVKTFCKWNNFNWNMKTQVKNWTQEKSENTTPIYNSE